MGKPTGFIEFDPQRWATQPVEDRLTHYREFIRPVDSDILNKQAARCMECSIPFCHSSAGCPVDNLIPEWNDLVYKNLWNEAYHRLAATNNFPEFTGRLCPAPCETACTLAINDSPVTIKQIELAIIEHAYAHGWVEPEIPAYESGKKVAVIGSGPAGLAAAQQLRREGHSVTVFERSAKLGGLLRYGIPDFKLEKHIIDRRLQQLKKEGVVFETDINIGEDISARYLQKSYDVILLAMGAGKERELDVPGRNLNGVYQAMDYLTLSNQLISGEVTKSQIITAKDKRVLVLGGGDTGADCVGNANRQGAKEVLQYEILPKPEDWKHSWNPSWPNWPNILRTSTSHEEGCTRKWSVLIKSLIGNDNRLAQIELAEIAWNNNSTNDEMAFSEIDGSEAIEQIDMLILAIGFEHVEPGRLLADLGVDFDDKGSIATDSNHQTSIPGIFATGDASVGASLVVTAIKDGRSAAKSIHTYLS